MQKLIRKTIALTCLTGFLLSLTACGSKSGSSTSSSDSEPLTSTEDGDVTSPAVDDSILQNGSLSSDAWKKGAAKINGTTFNLAETTLEQFTTCGYQADDATMNYILRPRNYTSDISLQDGKHQSIRLGTQNYSNDKHIYQKHALIYGYAISFVVGNGLEAPDVVLPGNIKGGMTRDEIIAIVGPSDDEDTLYYSYEENGSTVYKLDFRFSDDTKVLESVSYQRSGEVANSADDSDAIRNSVDTTSETSISLNSEPSEVLKDAEIKIGSSVYTMPISMEDLTGLGYSLDVSNNVMNPKESNDWGWQLTDKGGNVFDIEELYNPSDKPRDYNHCLVTDLEFGSDAEKVSIAQGIRVGSTYDEVISAFGKAEIEDDDDYYGTIYTYSAKRGEVKVTFVFEAKSDKVVKIQMSVRELTNTDED